MLRRRQHIRCPFESITPLIKTMTENSPFRCYRPERGYCVFCRGDPGKRWMQFEPLFDRAWDMEAVKVKKSRKVVVKHAAGGKSYYVKIYSRRHASGIEHNLLRGSSLTCMRSKARKHLRKARSLTAAGLSVAEPCMVIERRYGLIRQESMLVTPEYPQPSLGECFGDEKTWENYLPALEHMIRDIATMHRNRYVQRDPHFGNVLVRDDLSIIWLDFGTIKRFRLQKKKTYRDLRKLWEKSVKMLNGRVDVPEQFAAELLLNNYPDHRLLRKAVPATDG